LVTVVVSDYDEAISYYTQQLGFALVEDSKRCGASTLVAVDVSGTDRVRAALGGEVV
jgi:catechol 2,3-dioxygenase-like lactoylglutathione lyase family enzyme